MAHPAAVICHAWQAELDSWGTYSGQVSTLYRALTDHAARLNAQLATEGVSGSSDSLGNLVRHKSLLRRPRLSRKCSHTKRSLWLTVPVRWEAAALVRYGGCHSLRRSNELALVIIAACQLRGASST